MLKRKKLIIFDLWQTLAFLKEKPTDLFKKYLNLNDDGINKFFNSSEFFTKNLAFEKAIYSYFGNDFNKSSLDDLILNWNLNNKTATINKHTKELIIALKKDYLLAIITNVDKEGFETFTEKEFLTTNFDYLFLSYKQGIKKPDKECWRKIINYFNISSDQILMIGDSYENDIEPVVSLGIKAIYVTKEFQIDDSILVIKSVSKETLIPLLANNFAKE